MNDLYVYDIEIYPNVFTVCVLHVVTDQVWRYEISPRTNQGVDFFQFLTLIKNNGGRLVGFNNVAFDYPVIHELITMSGHITAYELYLKAYGIITSESRFGHTVWDSDVYVPQVDLFKIHHFDNVARSTSLKMLEFNMGSENIQDLPFQPNTLLTNEQIDTLIKYNDHDVYETAKFLKKSLPLLEFRDQLTNQYDRNFTNHNDTKIGKDFFIMRLERAGIPCYEKVNNKKQPRQTLRPTIHLNDVILPWIQFNNPEFKRIINWLRGQSISETKGIFKELNCTIDNFQYDFGTGGIHGSIDAQIVNSTNSHLIIDLDVASYYPNLAITNRFYPEHLTEQFCNIYQDVYNQRKSFKKGTPENAMLKLALNGVYGDSNNKYSPFYDPAYTMAITINGQLLLCLLAEYLITMPNLSMVQINTDGLTVRCPREQIDSLTFIAKTWEQLTGLELERADYKRMMIRDVNNYIAEYESGKLKRKGAYCHSSDLTWHQNFSSQIVAIAAENELILGVPVEDTIRCCNDPMLFMKRTKVPRSSELMLESEGGNVSIKQQNITRYLVTNSGGSLIKVMPPTPAQVKKDANAPNRRIGIDVGWLVTPCNHLNDSKFNDINYDYYIKEAKKLVEPLR